MSQGFTNSSGLVLPLPVSSGGTGSATGSLLALLPTGALFNLQNQTFTGTTIISAVATWTDTGVTVSITPTSATNTVLVRASINVCQTDNFDYVSFRLVRDSTAIGVGATAGSRTLATSGMFVNIAAIAITTSPLETLDSPATTSATTYKVQAFIKLGNTIYINRTLTDTNSDSFPRYVSSITVCEVKV